MSNRPGEHITGLEWKAYDIPVQVISKDDTRQAFVEIDGTLPRTDVNLVYGQRSVPLTPNGTGGASFSQKVPLNGKITLLAYSMVDDYGRTQEERIALVFPKWKTFSTPKAKRPKQKILANAGLALSYENYQEPTQSLAMTEWALTGKATLGYVLTPNKWELSGNIFGNLIPIIHQPHSLDSALWYGLNARVGYRLPFENKDVNLWVSTGWYAWGMYVADSSYGVASLNGPQLFLNARITPPGSRVGWVYVKWASITDFAQGLISFKNRELAGGAGISVSKPGAKHPVSVSVDVADAKYVSGDYSTAFHLLSAGVGFGVGL